MRIEHRKFGYNVKVSSIAQYFVQSNITSRFLIYRPNPKFGCNVEIIDLLGLVKIAAINNSVSQTSYFFLGAVHKWRYIMSKNFPGKETKAD